ncbi:hypothetical protein [Microtetraspora malaysiensis]|uniref:hypothetical protein n=1 Tax=Microtetraspora malaysiensis TaxID=161358 RepID=UPI003D8FA3DF
MTCQAVVVSVTSKDESGQVTMREWLTCRHTAEHLATLLGAPHREAVMSPEAAAALDIRTAQMPGVVITDNTEA